LAACGATHNRKPLGASRSQLHLSIGGPLITVGVPFPAPYSVLGYAYGWNERLNIYGNWSFCLFGLQKSSDGSRNQIE